MSSCRSFPTSDAVNGLFLDTFQWLTEFSRQASGSGKCARLSRPTTSGRPSPPTAPPLHLGWPNALYLGWFGPVGVSAVFYLTLEAEELGLPETVMAAGIMIVVVSTVAHGVTSSAGRLLYRRDPDRTASARGLTLRHAVSGSPPGDTRQIEKTLQRAPAAMPSARLKPAVTTAVVADQARGTNAPGRVRAGGSPRP